VICDISPMAVYRLVCALRQQCLVTVLTRCDLPLPAIALLPLALLWLGLGIPSLVFVMVHSVLWAVELNTHTRFLAVPEDAAHGRPELRPAWRALRDADPDPGRVSVDSRRPQDRLGLRLAHAHRYGAGVRRVVAFGRPGVVYLREPQSARDGLRVRRPHDGDHHRPTRRERRLPHGRDPHRPQTGHAVVSERHVDPPGGRGGGNGQELQRAMIH
jgi:hypothetical protein